MNTPAENVAVRRQNVTMSTENSIAWLAVPMLLPNQKKNLALFEKFNTYERTISELCWQHHTAVQCTGTSITSFLIKKKICF